MVVSMSFPCVLFKLSVGLNERRRGIVVTAASTRAATAATSFLGTHGHLLYRAAALPVRQHILDQSNREL